MEATVWGLFGWRLLVEGSGCWVSEVSAQECQGFFPWPSALMLSTRFIQIRGAKPKS